MPWPAAQDAPKCFGKVATIVGTNGNDKIKGTPKADVIVAKGVTTSSMASVARIASVRAVVLTRSAPASTAASRASAPATSGTASARTSPWSSQAQGSPEAKKSRFSVVVTNNGPDAATYTLNLVQRSQKATCVSQPWETDHPGATLAVGESSTPLVVTASCTKDGNGAKVMVDATVSSFAPDPDELNNVFTANANLKQSPARAPTALPPTREGLRWRSSIPGFVRHVTKDPLDARLHKTDSLWSGQHPAARRT